MITLSLVCPTLRPQNLMRLYESIFEAVAPFSWELILVGPFSPPSVLLEEPNVKYIQSYAPVPVCIQKGTLAAQYELVKHCVDDGYYLPNSLANAIHLWASQNDEKAIVNCRYSEGVSFNWEPRPTEFFLVENCPEFHLSNIKRDFATSVQPLMSRNYFIKLGGMDCCYEYSNWAHHDLMFRAQYNGSKIVHSETPCMVCSHYPNTSADHQPIHDAQLGPDQERFIKEWDGTESIEPCIEYDHYKIHDKPWQRRFKKLYNTYEEMVEGEGYKL